MVTHDSHKNKVEITHFFNKTEIIQINIIPKINLIIKHKIFFLSDDEKYYHQNHQRFYFNQRPRSYIIEQPDIYEPYTLIDKYNNLEIIQHLTTITCRRITTNDYESIPNGVDYQ